MATITRYPVLRHLRGAATTYVQHRRGERIVHQGVGASFWFHPRTAVLSEVPVDDRDLALLVHARTADLQEVTVTGTVTYRFADPAVLLTRLDFGIDPLTGSWRGMPLEQVSATLTEAAAAHVVDLVASMDLATALRQGVSAARTALSAGLQADQRLAETGIAVLAAQVSTIRPNPELERALQTPTREAIAQEADRATFERRALAVEREAAIGENELTNQIELARREEALVAQRGQNARRAAQDAAAADRVAAGAEAERITQLAQARAEATRAEGLANAAGEAARLAAYADASSEVLFALTAREFAGQLPDVQQLTVTPDLLTGLLARLDRR